LKLFSRTKGKIYKELRLFSVPVSSLSGITNILAPLGWRGMKLAGAKQLLGGGKGKQRSHRCE
jgi:hypothetical protein